MMHHPIAKGCGANEPLFRIMDVEAVVGARLVTLFLQIGLQLRQLTFLVEFKGRHRCFATLALARRAIGQVNIFKITKLRIKPAIGLGEQRSQAILQRIQDSNRFVTGSTSLSHNGDLCYMKIRH